MRRICACLILALAAPAALPGAALGAPQDEAHEMVAVAERSAATLKTGADEALAGTERMLDDVRTCTQPTPLDGPQILLPGGPSGRVFLDVRVVLERRDLAAGRRAMAAAARAYAPLGITLRATYHASNVRPFAGDLTRALDPVKRLYGGKRPRGVDVVYLMTRHFQGGFADCIGGVRHPRRAFAMGSVRYETPLPSSAGPVTAAAEPAGKIAAHEIGHLLGAHHHLSNCAEPAPGAAAAPTDVAPCTVMSPKVEMLSLRFSSLNGNVIRHHAVRYARP